MGYCFTYYGPWGSTGFAGPFKDYEGMINCMIHMKDEEWESQAQDIMSNFMSFDELDITVYKIERDGPFTREEEVIKGWHNDEKEWQEYRKKLEEEREREQYERLKEKFEKET